MRLFLSALLAAMLINCTAGTELNWPQFRGPRGDGTSLATHVPLNWSETNNIAWKVSIPGRGRSSPVVLGDRIWLTTAMEQGVVRTRIGGDDMQTAEHVSLEAVCLDRADGKILWRTHAVRRGQTRPGPLAQQLGHAHAGRRAGTTLLRLRHVRHRLPGRGDRQGSLETRLPLDHQVGPGSSPVLYQNLLILVRDGRDAQYVAALDKHTGRTSGKPTVRRSRPPAAT